MDMFYKKKLPEKALSADLRVKEAPKAVGQAQPKELSFARLGLAVGFLVLLLVAGLAASHFKIDPWDSVLPSVFQLLVGAVIGAVIGEKIGAAA